MAKKKAAAQKPAPAQPPLVPTPPGTPAAREARRVTERDMFLAGAPPWESYGRDASAEGLAALAEDGETEVLIGAIEDAGDGKVKITHIDPKRPRDAGLREDFNTGGEEGGRVVFSADAFYYVLLTDDMKYRAMQNSYKFHREDPVYRGLVNSLVNFVIGKGLKWKALDENPEVQDYLLKFWELNKMRGKDAELVKRHFLTGEVALRFYPRGEGDVAAKFPAVRLIPFWRLAEVLKDPEDAEKIVGYKVWRASGPYKPQDAEETLGPDDMLFWKNSTPEEDRGEPPLLAAMRPCKWYQDWIFNRVILNRYRTSIVLFKKILTGSPGAVSSVANASPNATTSHAGLGGKIEKRLPKPGSVVTHNDKIEYEWKSPQLQASDAGEDGRKIILYIAAAAQVPEFVLGDASNANFASTFVAENPFIRQVEAYQSYFEGLFGELFRRVIQHGIDTGQLPKMSTETKLEEGGPLARATIGLLRKLRLNEAADALQRKTSTETTRAVPTRTDVAIEWPSLLYKDQLADAQTMQIHQAMGLVSRQTLRGKAGYEQAVEEQRLADEGDQDLDQMERERQAMLDGADDAGGNGDPTTSGKGVPKDRGAKPKAKP